MVGSIFFFEFGSVRGFEVGVVIHIHPLFFSSPSTRDSFFFLEPVPKSPPLVQPYDKTPIIRTLYPRPIRARIAKSRTHTKFRPILFFPSQFDREGGAGEGERERGCAPHESEQGYGSASRMYCIGEMVWEGNE